MAESEPADESQKGRTLYDDAIGNLHIDRDLAFRFLVVFSRFEFALKAARFVYQGENERDLQVDFDCFARAIAEPFQDRLDGDDADLRAAHDYYHEEPPQKQIWNGHEPDWKKALPQNRTESDFLLILLRRVRNNLFHGGKGWKRAEGTTGRDDLLMKHGLRILEVMIECEPDTSRNFSTFG